MKPLIVITATAAIAYFLMSSTKKKTFAAIVSNQQIRGCDPKGCGGFGEVRSGHTHQGIDIVAKKGQNILSPISGTVTRFPFPYGDDLRFTGIEIKNDTYSVKMFYVVSQVFIGDYVKQGESIANAQDLSIKYGITITNHVHLEVRETPTGKLIDPTNLF